MHSIIQANHSCVPSRMHSNHSCIHSVVHSNHSYISSFALLFKHLLFYYSSIHVSLFHAFVTLAHAGFILPIIGKSVGFVTTDALVGASPASGYAHAAFRNWRADYELPDDAKGICKDIARQLVEDNLNIQVGFRQ